MKIVLLGPPGVGKGTQAARLCAHFSLTHLSTGDMLRDNVARKTQLGALAKQKMEAGELVPDDLIINMIGEKIAALAGGGCLFDGFPRTLQQAEKLAGGDGAPDVVVDLDLDDEKIIERLCGRWVHPASGRTYHIHFSPPQTAGRDDETGEPLIQRDDDKAETIRRRLRVYRHQTLPLKSFYQQQPTVRYIACSGDGDIAQIGQTLVRQIAADA